MPTLRFIQIKLHITLVGAGLRTAINGIEIANAFIRAPQVRSYKNKGAPYDLLKNQIAAAF